MYFKMLLVLMLGRDCGVSEYLVCQLSSGASCPKVVHPNTALVFICNIEAQLGITIWLLPNETCTEKQYSERIALLQPKYGGCNPSSSNQHGTCGPFTAQNVASSGCANSSLSVVATPELNGTRIWCMNHDGSSLFPIGNATISILDSNASRADASMVAMAAGPGPTIPASGSCPSMLSSDTHTAAVGSSISTTVGVSVSVTFVVSFSMGAIVASVLCYISRESKGSSRKPSSHSDHATVHEMNSNKKIMRDAVELNMNTGFGSHILSTEHEVGTNKKMEGDVIEIRPNTSYVTVHVYH